MELLLNLSGHPAPEGAEEEFSTIVAVNVPNVEMSNGEAVAEAAQNLVKKVLEKADSDEEEALLRGKAEVLLPGASVLAVSVYSVLTGLVGDPLNVRWAVRNDGDFELSPSLAAWELSHSGRGLRSLEE